MQWICDWSEAKAQTFSLYQGETATFEPTFRVNGQLVTNATIEAVWYQTNGMDQAWWKLDGNTFAPSNDVGAAAYRFFVEGKASSDTIYRANGTLRMLPSPGFTPNALPLPVWTIDFAEVQPLNAPWLLPAATNALASSLSSQLSLASRSATNYTDSATNALAAVARSGSYTDLSNKPQINGITLTGNKTGAQLGLATPANVAAAALAATNYTDAAAALKSRTALGGFVTSPSTFVDGEETYTSQIPYWDDSGSDGAGWYVYNDGLGEIAFLSNDPNAMILAWFVSMIDYHEFVATRQTVVIPGYILGAQTNKPLASAEMAITNSADIAALASRLSQVSQSATNYTDAAISPTSPAFSNAVLAVGLGIDTNTVAVINELVDSAHDLPVTGATSVGALLLALAAAIAALKKNLRYSYNDATVSSGTTPTVTNLADRAINYATLDSSVTAATVTLPAATTGRARDFYIDLTIEASSAPTLTFIDPATSTTANVAFGANSLADIAPGYNLVLFTELPNNRWLVSANHEEAT